MGKGPERLTPPSFTLEVFDRTEASWNNGIRQVIFPLTFQTLGMRPSQSVLGMTDDVKIYAGFKDAFFASETTVVIARDNQKVIGYSLAMPIDKFNPSRISESNDTAYIYATVLTKKARGRSYGPQMTELLFRELVKKGFSFIERDALIADSWADTIQRHFSKFPGSIVKMHDHNLWPELGPERHFRIDLDSYLKNS